MRKMTNQDSDRKTIQVVHWRKAIIFCALVALLIAFSPLAVTAQPQLKTERMTQMQPDNQSRRERGNQVINKLTGGAEQPLAIYGGYTAS